MEYPVAVALAEAVPTLPVGEGWWYEPKFDGHRLVMWRDEETTRCHTRSGRTVTSAWMDLAVAGQAALRPGTVLDGEAVVWRDGRLDFAAAQARGNSTPRRAAELAAKYPAHYAAFDCLMLDGQDLRGRPYTEHRAALLDVLDGVPPPIQAVPATDDPAVALAWYEHLQEQGIEGIVAKKDSGYRGGRIWKKIRHSEPLDAEVVGYTGPPARPRRVAVLLPDGRRVLSRPLAAPYAAELGQRIREAGPGRRARTPGGEPYTTTAAGMVEVAAGTSRHATVTVTRVR